MNRKTVLFGSALLLLASMLLLSAKTEDKKKGFDAKTLEKSLCYIPIGSYMFEDSSRISDYKIKEKMVSLSAFYMCNHTVTNEEYGIFLADLKTTDPSSYIKMLPDTLVWRTKTSFMEDFVKYYFRHPSYQDYPVVGISHEQAEEYCKWLTRRYIKDPKRKFKNVVFRLPNLYQWDWAASGGLAMARFPWGGPYVRNYKGQAMANFRFVPDQCIKKVADTGKFEIDYSVMYDGVAGDLNDAADITAPVISYWPNGYGLYNMAGNVEQYIDEIGITKGGCWCTPGYYLQIWAQDHYKNAQSASDKIGFRVSMKVEN